jgi:hypothetical protein
VLKKSCRLLPFYLQHIFTDFDNRPISWGWFIIERAAFHSKVGIDSWKASGAMPRHLRREANMEQFSNTDDRALS